MDKIIMSNMAFHGYHGVMEEEKKQGQRFFVDATLSVDLKEAGTTDDLNYTVNYAKAFHLIEKIVETERFDLIEALAERLCSELLDNFDTIMKVKLTVKKPEAPVTGKFDYFAVQIERKREMAGA